MKPATPLPWDYATIESAIIPGTYIVDQEGDRINRVPLDKEDDTIFLVHAANAYPRLVEALRFAIDCALNGIYIHYSLLDY